MVEVECPIIHVSDNRCTLLSTIYRENPLPIKMSADLMLAGDAGDQFPKLFYSTLDNNRQVNILFACLNIG